MLPVVAREQALSVSTQQRLDAAAGALARIQEGHTLAFFQAHSSLFVCCLQNHYPLTSTELQAFDGLWDWKRLSASRALA